jgi:HSP20 family protein
VFVRRPHTDILEHQSDGKYTVREVGPIVYGYSMTIGPDGRPKVREFGNVRVPGIGGKGYAAGPQITAEREPLADVMTSDKEVKVVIEMPGVTKENIKVNVHDNSLEVTSNDPQRKYREVIDLPPEADIETAKSNYKNGIVEVVFKKKEQAKPKGKEIKVE